MSGLPDDGFVEVPLRLPAGDVAAIGKAIDRFPAENGGMPTEIHVRWQWIKLTLWGVPVFVVPGKGPTFTVNQDRFALVSERRLQTFPLPSLVKERRAALYAHLHEALVDVDVEIDGDHVVGSVLLAELQELES